MVEGNIKTTTATNNEYTKTTTSFTVQNGKNKIKFMWFGKIYAKDETNEKNENANQKVASTT